MIAETIQTGSGVLGLLVVVVLVLAAIYLIRRF